VKNCVGDPATYAAQKEEFNQFFQEYFFPLMTQSTPAELGELGKNRYDFFRQYMWPARSPQLQADLTAMTKNYMQRVLADTGYHPSVRYNALLMIGMLDAKYATDQGDQAEPLPEATALLVQIVNAAGKSRKVTPELLVGALIGLERHSQLSAALPPQAVPAIESSMLKILGREEPIAELDPEVNDWIGRQAASVLVNLGQSGPSKAAVDGLLSFVANDEITLTERCLVAAMLKRLDLSGSDGGAAAKSLILLANDVASEHAEKAREFEDMRIGGGVGIRGGGRGGRGGYGGGIGGETADYERRHLITHLGNVLDGLDAVDPIAEGDDKTHVTDVRAFVNSTLVKAKDDKTLNVDLTADVKRMARDIRAVAKMYNQPAATPATAQAVSGDESVN
jgi:hypothetical protein